MLINSRRSTQQLAQEYHSLKSRTTEAEGSSEDLDKTSNGSHLQDVEDLGAKTGELDQLYMTTDSKARFDTGTYSQSKTITWHDQKTFQYSTTFQERPDGLVETLETRDMDGDGRLEAVTRQVFNPTNYDGFNLL